MESSIWFTNGISYISNPASFDLYFFSISVLNLSHTLLSPGCSAPYSLWRQLLFMITPYLSELDM